MLTCAQFRYSGPTGSLFTLAHSSCLVRPADCRGSSREEENHNEPATKLSSGPWPLGPVLRERFRDCAQPPGFKHVSVPVLPEQDSSSKWWAQPDSCLLEKQEELGVPRPESGTGGERSRNRWRTANRLRKPREHQICSPCTLVGGQVGTQARSLITPQKVVL